MMRQVSQDVGCNMGFKGGSEGGGHWISKELMTLRGATSGGWGPGKEYCVLSAASHATTGKYQQERS